MAGDMQADIPGSGAVFTYGRSRFANNVASYFFIRNDPIAAISCGDEHTAIVCQNGRIFTFGSNSWGQLGLGHKNTITMPSCMKSLKPEKANDIACGKSHTVISTVSGKVFACGSNANGQLGIPEVTERTIPTQVTGIPVKPGGIKQVSAGCLHSACLTDDGKVYVWGTNTDGQLGLGGVVETADVPSLVKLPKPAVYISCGYYHTAFVTDDGKLYTCGEGENGKLGLSETWNAFIPTLVNIDSPVELVACGGSHTIAVTKNYDVYAFGSNFRGQLGLESNVEFSLKPLLVSALAGMQIRSVACGESHTAFVSVKGQFYVCGDGRYGKLCKDVNDDAEDASEFLPRQVDRFDNYVVTLVACGGCHTMVHAALKTSEVISNGTDAVNAVTDQVGKKSPNPSMQAGDAVTRLPRSARLPPLNLSRQNGSALDSPSVEVAPGNIEPLTDTTPKTITSLADTPPDTVNGSATPPKTVPSSPPNIVTPPKTVTTSSSDSVTSPAKNITGTVSPPNTNTASPSKTPATPPRKAASILEDISHSDERSSETEEEKVDANGSDTTRQTGESLDEVLHKLNVKDASELNDMIAMKNEEKGEEEEPVDGSTDKMAASGNTIVLSEVIKSEPEPAAETATEEVGDTDGVDNVEGKQENGEVPGEGNGEEITAEIEIVDEVTKTKENEVIAEQDDGNEMKDIKKPKTAESVESRVSKFLSTFRRKKLSEENISLSPAWTTVDGKMSNDNTIINNRMSEKSETTQAKYGQPQRSKACVIL